MSSLAHTRSGIPDAMFVVGAVELLKDKLYSNDDQVRDPSTWIYLYMNLQGVSHCARFRCASQRPCVWGT